ncbi:hypothetical protein A2U01_0088625, partial [Trifolium medium]|nr:hypothetical protein [Trifolium medium]
MKNIKLFKYLENLKHPLMDGYMVCATHLVGMAMGR